jgi:caffeoyl-CoA O-methyltransferase
MNIVATEIENYIHFFSKEEDKVLAALNRHTHTNVLLPQMLSGKSQGIFLQFISKMIQPKYILEIGTFTGYSAICLAAGLQQNGQLFTIDCNEELANNCIAFFEKANLQDKITLIIGNAKDEIPKLDYQFDLIFIDADKQNYSHYFDLVIDKLADHGTILVDNVLWNGKVTQDKKDKDTLAIHQFNEKIKNDERVENVIISIRDGINIIRKK